MRKHGPLFLLSAHSAVGMAAPVALHGIRGILSFSKESIPLEPPRERTRGLAPRPRTLADRHLKSCAACGIGCGVRGFATNLLLFVADINRALLRGARVTGARRRTACGAALLRSPPDSKKRPRQRSFSSLISPCSASMSLICLSKTYSM